MVFRIIRNDGKNTNSYPITKPNKLSVYIKNITIINNIKKFTEQKKVEKRSFLINKTKVTGTVNVNNIKNSLLTVYIVYGVLIELKTITFK